MKTLCARICLSSSKYTVVHRHACLSGCLEVLGHRIRHVAEKGTTASPHHVQAQMMEICVEAAGCAAIFCNRQLQDKMIELHYKGADKPHIINRCQDRESMRGETLIEVAVDMIICIRQARWTFLNAWGWLLPDPLPAMQLSAVHEHTHTQL